MVISPLTLYFASFRSAESSRYTSMPVSETCPEPAPEQDEEDNNREDLFPLNLSTRSQDSETSPSDHRLRCSDAEKLKGEELPLNLSLRPPYSSPVHSSAPSEHLQQSPDTEFDDEPCDQRQTAALALCQLAIASSAISSCDFNAADRPSEEPTDTRSSPKKTKHTTKVKTTGVKRANSGQAEKCHKPNKRSKTAGRALRRRPRCC